MSDSAGGVRLAELVAVLSLGTDLGLGQPMEHVLRQTLIALRLAEHVGLDDGERTVLYYSGLLAWVGCHVDAHEQARWFGDDIAAKRDARFVDLDGAWADVKYVLANVGRDRPPLERVRTGAGFVAGGYKAIEQMLGNHCLATEWLAESLGLGEGTRECLRQSFERWDGRGAFGKRGEQILVTSRLIALADVLEVYHRADGLDGAIGAARERRGTEFDPSLADLFVEHAAEVCEGLDAETTWETIIALEPELERRLSDDELASALEAIADFTDLKSPYTLGHSRSVAELAGAAARGLGLLDRDAETVRRAGLVHDLGRLGVSNAIWDKRGPLTRAELERIRLHPYLTQRMLAFCDALAPLGALAVHHHERLDGSGYPHGVRGDALPPAARLLAAADTYCAKTEPRPHRDAGSGEEAASLLRGEVRSGRLDGDAVDAVLRAAGHRVSRRREGPAGLTPRELEVLRLLARGLSTKEIAERLVITRKTAANHVEHIYAKAGISNRAQASLFAVQHGLMSDSVSTPVPA
jgi:HD-GYP domain-containing protein (c-di-GMP phosphodiesterase class II)